MAKLIVTRPRLGRLWDTKLSFDVLIDGKPAAPIGLGETIAIDLTPGPHQVSARIARVGTQPIVVEPGLDETHRLAVGFNVGFNKLFTRSWTLGSLPFFVLSAWFLFDLQTLLTRGLRGGTAPFHGEWQIAIMIPAGILTFLVPLAFPLLWPNQFLVVLEISGPDRTEQQIAELLRAHPFRVRITIRHMMIAVALLALAFWASLEVYRFTRASSFRSQARLHADEEAMFRKFEQGWINSDFEMKKRGFGRGHFSKEAAKAAAVADYHAALRRKYEQAAARGAFSVEPDPQPPPWP
jgi:hypothetical protein